MALREPRVLVLQVNHGGSGTHERGVPLWVRLMRDDGVAVSKLVPQAALFASVEACVNALLGGGPLARAARARPAAQPKRGGGSGVLALLGCLAGSWRWCRPSHGRQHAAAQRSSSLASGCAAFDCADVRVPKRDQHISNAAALPRPRACAARATRRA